MNLDLTDDEAAALLRELDGLIDGDRYFMSQRIKTLKAIRAKIRPEPVPLPSPPKQYAPPRATVKQRRRAGRYASVSPMRGRKRTQLVVMQKCSQRGEHCDFIGPAHTSSSILPSALH
jgi:hypothetical protein